MNILKKIAVGVAATGTLLVSAVPAFAAGAEVVVEPGQEVTGSLTKDFNGAPVPEVEFISGGDVNTEVTGTICDGVLVWSLRVAPGDGSVRTDQ